MMMNSEYILPAAAITAGITAGPIMMAYMNPKENTAAVGNFLFTALVGSCVLGLTGIIFPSFGQMWFRPEPYISILLFSGYNWYHTQCMIQSYKENKLDPIGHSVNYTLNAVNIMIRVMELLARSNRK